ncbi:hypothetical protein D3C78_1018780 [compost metagenome]
MLLGKVFTHHPDIKRWRAPLSHFFGIGQNRAVFFQRIHRRCPDIRSVNISTLPGSNNGGRLQVKDLHLIRLDTPVLECRQQAVVGG